MAVNRFLNVTADSHASDGGKQKSKNINSASSHFMVLN
jgi:hypothetical protein